MGRHQDRLRAGSLKITLRASGTGQAQPFDGAAAESLQRLVRDIDGALDVRTVRGVMTGIRLRMRVAKTW